MEKEVRSHTPSELCLACGLCCSGVLHNYARLLEAEIEQAGVLGLEVIRRDGRLYFALPCPQHQHGRCQVYSRRLYTCHHYRCQLLKDLTEDPGSWDKSWKLVQEMKRLLLSIAGQAACSPVALRDIEAMMQGFEKGEGLLGPAESRLKHRELLGDIMLFNMMINRYFYPPGE